MPAHFRITTASIIHKRCLHKLSLIAIALQINSSISRLPLRMLRDEHPVSATKSLNTKLYLPTYTISSNSNRAYRPSRIKGSKLIADGSMINAQSTVPSTSCSIIRPTAVENVRRNRRTEVADGRQIVTIVLSCRGSLSFECISKIRPENGLQGVP